MSLDFLYAEAKEKSTLVVGKCVVGQWALSLPEKDQEAFKLSLNDDDFSTRSLFDIYKNAGASFGLTSLGEHRRGGCGCR
jgi:hypothetical protein